MRGNAQRTRRDGMGKIDDFFAGMNSRTAPHGKPAAGKAPTASEGQVKILGISMSKSTLYLNIAVMAVFAILVLAFAFFIRTDQTVSISETPYSRTANLALRAGETYTYMVNSSTENSTVEFIVSDGGQCKNVEMQSYGQSLMSFCLGYDGRADMLKLPKDQQANQVLMALANSSLGMPNLPIKPWMLGLGDGFHYYANLTYLSSTGGIVQSSGTIGQESFEVLYLGNGTKFGREAYEVTVRSTSLNGETDSTLWIDAQKRVMLEMTGPDGTTKLVSAPFPLNESAAG